mgnify:CR=1 FL=1
MVKNNKGGKNAKKMGRKFASGSTMADRRVRYSECDEEQYACVTRYHGGGQVDVMCIDGQTRLGIIRKKFRGRSKRDNFIGIGTYVLVGLRDWEVVAKGKKRKCDLLEVYSMQDIEQIKRYLLPEEWETIRNKGDESKKDYSEENMIEFVDGETAEYIREHEERIMENQKIQDDGSVDAGASSDGSDHVEDDSYSQKMVSTKTKKDLEKEKEVNKSKIIDDNDEEIDIDDI